MNSTSFAFSVLWQTAGWTMLQFLWIGGLAGLAASLMNRGLRRYSPTARYAAALAQFAIVAPIPLCLFVLKFNDAAVALREAPAAERGTAGDVLVPAAGDLPLGRKTVAVAAVKEQERSEFTSANAGRSPAGDHPSTPTGESTVPAANSAAPHPVARSEPSLLQWLKTSAPTGAGRIMNLLPWVWVLGFPLTCLLLLSGIAGAERFRRQCRILDDDRLVAVCRRLQTVLRLSGNVALGVSDCIATPILVGIVRPLILLPASTLAGLSTAQLEMILLHELGHVRRWDNLVNLVQRMVEAVLFFHPAVWWLSNRVRLEREHCCDAIVLAHIGGPQEYAEILVQMALTPPRLQSVLGTSMAQQLIPRIRHILKQEDERMQVSRSLVAVALSLLVGLAVVAVASAQREPAKVKAAPPAAARAKPAEVKTGPQAPQKPLTAEERAKFISIQGTVLGSDGRPARWSQVWLVGMTRLPWGRYGAAQIEASRADANGKFIFRHPRWRELNPGPDEYSNLWVVARTRDGTLTMNTNLNISGEYRGKSEIHGLELNVLPQADYRGRIVDENGKPIADARVTPELLVLPPPKGQQIATMAWFPELAAEYEAVTNADGKFVLKGLPRSKTILAQIAAPSLGARGMYWQTDKQPELRIEPGGTIRGKLTNPPDAEYCSQIELDLSMVEATRLDGPKPGVLFWARFRPEADGTFEITDVPTGQYRVQITPDRGGHPVPQAFYAPVLCNVKSGEIADKVELALPNVIVARGKVVNRESGAGVAGATVSFYEQQAQSRSYAGVATTNAQGEYRAYLLPGKIAVEHRTAPEGYLTPIDDLQSAAVMRTQDFEGPTLRLERAIMVHGTVVDQEGRPVAGADVRWIQPYRAGQALDTQVVSDESGNFVIPQVDPEEALPLRVRTPTATSTALMVQPGELGDPQKIVISPQNAFRLKATLTDERGGPVPHAKVAVHWHRSFVSKKTRMSGLHGEFEKHETDEQGRFESAALWPGDEYHVEIEAQGFSKTDLPTVQGKSGAVQDYGAVRLDGTSHAISGRVVALDGTPIADATVFNSGDAPRVVTTQTGKDGRFRLDGLLAGPVHVFAQHDKYRFGGTYAKGTADEVSLTLTPLSAPPPQRQAVDFDALETVRRNQAEQLQAWITNAKLSLKPNLRDSRFDALAKADPNEALQQISKQSPAMDYRSAVVISKSLTPFQPRKEGLDATDKKSIETALKFVERAVSRIGVLDASRRMVVTADAGLTFLRLGDAKQGQPLVEAAAKEWSQNVPLADNPNSYAIVTIAQGLAWTDIPGALGLMEKVTDDHLKSRIRNKVIVEVSKFDVPRALALLNDPKYAPARDFYNDSLKFDLAYRIGHVNPQKAAELVATIGNPRTKAEACGWTAVAIAEQNPQLARSLIDEGLHALQTRRMSSPESSYYEYVPGVAAHLALQASQIKHPEIESIIQQALALRIPANAETSTVSRLQSTLNAALFLSFFDPPIARRLLADLEPSVAGKLLGDGGSASVGSREWYYAWVLADPEHAAELMQAELEKGKEAEDKVRDAFTLMFLPPAERLEFIRKFSSANVVAPDLD